MKKTNVNSLKAEINDAASVMPDISGKNILMGFWHNWYSDSADGYQFGRSTHLDLIDIPVEYNVIAVSFMKGSGIPTFKPVGYSDEEFRRQIGVLNSQGRAVLISLGGAEAHIELLENNQKALKKEIIRLVDVYGFDGLDIDLEQNAIDAANNNTVIPAVLKEVKDFYREKGQNFIISMAPEFPYLRTLGKYVKYINSLEGYYDFIAPQYYNQGGDGISSEEDQQWLAQNNDSVKEEFLYYLTKSIVTQTSGFVHIPPEKFVIGLPANNDAAATGYVIDPTAVYNTFKRLEDAGIGIKGLMTWSVNWDNGKDASNKPYSWEFVNRYKDLINNDNNGGNDDDDTVPSAPNQLISTQQTKNSITLQWSASVSKHTITVYSVYRDGKNVGDTSGLTYIDSGLTEKTNYTYFVTAWNNIGEQSIPSVSLTIATTASGGGNYPQWTIGKLYTAGENVSYKDKDYTALVTHTAQTGWEPDVALSLWKGIV